MQDGYNFFTLHFGYYNKYSENINVMNSTSASTTMSHTTHLRVPVMLDDDGPQGVHVDDIGKECVWRGLHMIIHMSLNPILDALMMADVHW